MSTLAAPLCSCSQPMHPLGPVWWCVHCDAPCRRGAGTCQNCSRLLRRGRG